MKLKKHRKYHIQSHNIPKHNKPSANSNVEEIDSYTKN